MVSKMKDTPLVSVIMSVYNTKIEYLQVALDSILNQTYPNLEFIIVDDASDQLRSEFLKHYKWVRQTRFSDDRIQLIRNVENRGLTASLNIALNQAKGSYIARMDSDDICFKTRIEKQIAYLEDHMNIDVLACGTYVYEGSTLLPRESDIIIGRQFAGGYRCFEQERMRVRLSLANIEFTHPTVVFRSEFLKKNNLWYDESIKKAQDYNMWVRCIERGKLDSLQEVLFISRIHEGQIGSCQIEEQSNCADITKTRCLERLLPDSSEREKLLYVRMRDVKMIGSAAENIVLIKKLIKANAIKKLYDARVYKQELFFWWLRKSLYKQNQPEGMKVLSNPYMFFNILKILVPQTFRYIMDLLYKKEVRKKWGEEMKKWVIENG